MAIEDYKTTFGAFPPDFAARSRKRRSILNAHVSRAFPRYIGSFPHKMGPNGLDPAEALVFWLGGYPTPVDSSTGVAAGTSKLLGFRKDKTNPFVADLSLLPKLATLGGWTPPRFAFDELRLRDIDGDGWLEYYPKNSQMPYVYFNSKSYSPDSPPPSYSPAGDQLNAAVPYRDSSTITSPLPKYINPNSYQILSAGQDNKYGSDLTAEQTSHGYPAGTYYTEGDMDNLTNFSEKGVLGDSIP